MTMTVDLQTLERHLQDPVYRATGWTAHCGCRHEPGTATLIKCVSHAAGARYVETEPT